MPSETTFQTREQIEARKWNGEISAKDAEVMAQKKIQESNKKLAEVEAKFISSMFDKYDTKENGFLTLDGLAPICNELNIKPWHVIRHVAASGKKGKEVTKEAFLNYWFEQSEKKRFYGNPPDLTPMKKKTSTLPTMTNSEWEAVKKDVVSNSQFAAKMYNEKLIEALEKSSKKFSGAWETLKKQAVSHSKVAVKMYNEKLVEALKISASLSTTAKNDTAIKEYLEIISYANNIIES